MSRLALAISNVHMLEGNPVGVDGPASVFVDIIGLPFTPLFMQGPPGSPRGAPTGMAPQPLRRRHITTRLAGTRRPSSPIPTLIRIDYAMLLSQR